MTTLKLIVNGEAREVEAEPRTQLAVVLRDALGLTGTHLSCEQGVCGACTVLVDDKPVRSCIAYAAACDGARVETVEGFRSDAVMDALRRAFSQHHALQCGFCTPGMLVTARDIVLRLPDAGEALIRRELSGNLCRCTGYVGIVAAVADVLAQRRSGALAAAPPAPALSLRAPLAPFAPARGEAAPASIRPPAAPAAQDSVEGWTVASRRFRLGRPLAAVEALFADLRRVAPCVPGASIDTLDGEAFTGTASIRFGPIHVAFRGKGRRRRDAASGRNVIEAEGGDANGQSRARGALAYRLEAADGGGATMVDLELRFRAEGRLAQFNRPDLAEGFIELMLKQFVANCEAALAGAAPPRDASISGFVLLLALLRQAWRALIGRGGSRGA